MESAGAKRANASLLSAVPIGDLRRIICDYYAVTGEELLRRTALSAEEEKLVSQINLESEKVSHTMQLDPRNSNRQDPDLELISLRPGQGVVKEVVDVILRLMEEQVRSCAADHIDYRAGTLPRIGVMSCDFSVSQEVLNNVGNNPEIDWLGWCAARNSVSSSFCLDLIMFPMYTRFPDGNPLYALGVINCRARCIELYHMMGPFAAGGAFPRVRGGAPSS